MPLQTDPYLIGIFDMASTQYYGMNLILTKDSDVPDANYEKFLRIIFLPNGSTRNTTYDNETSSGVNAIYQSGTTYYAVTGSFYTPMTVTINSYGDVGETIEGSFDITLCNIDIINADRIACLDEGNYVQLIGSFGIIREPDFTG